MWESLGAFRMLDLWKVRYVNGLEMSKWLYSTSLFPTSPYIVRIIRLELTEENCMLGEQDSRNKHAKLT